MKDPESRRPDEADIFRLIAECTCDWETWLIPNGRPRWINQAVERITGYTVAQCLDMPDYPLAMISPPDRARMSACFAGAATGSRGNDIEFRVDRRDGEMRWCSVSWQPLLDAAGRPLGSRTSIRDITDRKVRDEALIAALQRLKIHMHDSPLAVIERDAAGRIIRWSAEAERLFGWSERAVRGKTYEALNFGGSESLDASELSAVRSAAQMQGDRARLARHIAMDGSQRICAWYENAISDTGGRIISTLSLGLDITRQIEAERSLQESEAQLQRLVAHKSAQVTEEMQRRLAAERKAELAQRMETLGRLAGGLAHDFNNTLAAIRAFIELALANNGKSAADAYLGHALTAVEIATGVNRRLLSLTRREAGATLISTSEVLQAIAGVITHTIGSHIKVQLDLDGPLWPLHIDRSELEAAILNLSINSRDAMPNGGTLLLRARNCARNSSPEIGRQDGVEIIISDTGKGMSADVLKKLETPFFTTKGEFGSGLGLDSVRRFLSGCGGSLEIASKENEGTTVTMFMPRAAFSENGPQAAEDAPVPLGDGETILVIASDPGVLKAACVLLEGLAYSPICAASVEEALNILDSGEQVHAVILSLTRTATPDKREAMSILQRHRPALPLMTLADASLTDDAGPVAASQLAKPASRRNIAESLRSALTSPAVSASHDTRSTSPVKT